MLEPQRRLSALATAGLDREGQEPGQHIPTQPDPAVSPRPPGSAHPIGLAGEREQAKGGAGPPPSAQRGLPRLTPKLDLPSAAAFYSPAGPPPPRADTHQVVTAEPNLRAQGQPATAAFGRPTRAEHARTPASQGPVWPVTPAINRSPDPALPPRQDAPPPGSGPARPSRPAPAREFPAFLRVMLHFRGAP